MLPEVPSSRDKGEGGLQDPVVEAGCPRLCLEAHVQVLHSTVIVSLPFETFPQATCGRYTRGDQPLPGPMLENTTPYRYF